MANKPVGTMFAEIDLDTTKYERSQQQLYRNASATIKDIETDYSNLSAKQNAKYDEMYQKADKTYQEISKVSNTSSEQIIKQEQAKADQIKKITDEQYKAEDDHFEKIKEKLIDIGNTALKVAEIMSSAFMGFEVGASATGSPWGGAIGAGTALFVELYNAMDSAKAEAADLEDKYFKIYEIRQQAAALSVSEYDINREINELIGDQLSSWAKIKAELPDVAKEFLRAEQNFSDAFGVGDLSLNKTFEEMGEGIDKFVKSLDKPKSEMENFFQSQTDVQMKELAKQYVAAREMIDKNAKNQQEANEAMLQLMVKFTLDKQQILSDGAQKELEAYNRVFENIGATVNTNYINTATDKLIILMESRYKTLLDAEEKSNTAILHSSDEAHEIRLAHEKEFEQKLLDIANDYKNKASEAYRIRSDSWLSKDQGAMDNAQNRINEFNKKFEASDKDARKAAIRRERDEILNAAEQTGDGKAKIVKFYNDKIVAIDEEGIKSRLDKEHNFFSSIQQVYGEFQSSSMTAFDSVRDEWQKLTNSAYDYQKLKIAEWFDKEVIALGGENEALIKVRENREKLAQLEESRRQAVANIDLMSSGYTSDYFFGMPTQKENDKAITNYEKSMNTMVGLSKHAASQIESAFSSYFFDSMTGKIKSLEDFWESTLNTMAKIASDILGQVMRQMMFGIKSGESNVLNDIMNMINPWTPTYFEDMATGPLPYAHGGAFSGASIGAYSNSVVSSPTLFKFASGIGLMGEAGSEAIMPLTRTRSGDLGVKTTVSSAPTVKIEVNNHGMPQSYEQKDIKFDGEAWVINVVAKDMMTDKYGLRTLMGAR